MTHPRERRVACLWEEGIFPEGWTSARYLDIARPFIWPSPGHYPRWRALVELRPMTLRERIKILATRKRYPGFY